MAAPTNTFLSFSAVGNREDIAAMIYNISPSDTPFLGAIESSKATSILHEWQTDALASPADNARIEGDNVSDTGGFAPVGATVRLGNRCQISSKEVSVSGTQDSVQKAGRDRELIYQLLKKTRELKRDMEYIIAGNQAPDAGGVNSARRLRPLCGWYSTNALRGSGGASGTVTAAAVDGTQRPLTESLVKNALQQAWVAGGSPDLILAGPFNKTVFSAFTGGMQRTRDTSDGTLSTAIDVYESDFGLHKIVASRFSRERDLHLLTTDLWAAAYLREMQTNDLARTGDNHKAQIVVEYTLEARNEAASAIVADLTTGA